MQTLWLIGSNVDYTTDGLGNDPNRTKTQTYLQTYLFNGLPNDALMNKVGASTKMSNCYHLNQVQQILSKL